MSASSIFDRILTSTPVNRSAGVAVSGVQSVGFLGGDDGRLHKKAPIASRRPNEHEIECMKDGFVDFTGKRVGKLVVVGIFDHVKEGFIKAPQSQRWVVRCSCGDYEVRSAKALKNPENASDACRECGRLEHFRQKSIKQAKGIIPRVSIEDAANRFRGGGSK